MSPVKNNLSPFKKKYLNNYFYELNAKRRHFLLVCDKHVPQIKATVFITDGREMLQLPEYVTTIVWRRFLVNLSPCVERSCALYRGIQRHSSQIRPANSLINLDNSKQVVSYTNIKMCTAHYVNDNMICYDTNYRRTWNVLARTRYCQRSHKYISRTLFPKIVIETGRLESTHWY